MKITKKIYIILLAAAAMLVALCGGTVYADADLPKPTVVIEPVFGGRTVQLRCGDRGAEIYYSFGSSNITTSCAHVKAGEKVFLDEAMTGKRAAMYFKAYKDGKWSPLGKWGVLNVQIAEPVIKQSGPKGSGKYRVYTQTKNSYIVYTLDGSMPAVEEGVQKLKVKNGRIVWGTSAVIDVPKGRTLRAIAIRCGLVTSSAAAYSGPASGGDKIKPVEPLITFSGSGAELVAVKNRSYYIGDRYVLYLDKGTIVPGDMPQLIERVMADLEKLYGLSYSYRTTAPVADWRKSMCIDGFYGINTDKSKIDIYIAHDVDDGAVQQADGNFIQLFDTDFVQAEGVTTTVYHELSHVLRLRQGPFLGQTFEEGIGLFSEYALAKADFRSAWNMMQYVDTNGYQEVYDASRILADPQKEFKRVTLLPRSGTQEHYHYGIRFITFLTETYGMDVIERISVKSRKYIMSD
ncbi:MAG: hypothetical protein IKR73_02925, partial [Oscillospiraceae bacterium]|nr:hypothetical protein [Oscillospiraceae bacterium]